MFKTRFVLLALSVSLLTVGFCSAMNAPAPSPADQAPKTIGPSTTTAVAPAPPPPVKAVEQMEVINPAAPPAPKGRCCRKFARILTINGCFGACLRDPEADPEPEKDRMPVYVPLLDSQEKPKVVEELNPSKWSCCRRVLYLMFCCCLCNKNKSVKTEELSIEEDLACKDKAIKDVTSALKEQSRRMGIVETKVDAIHAMVSDLSAKK